ncbi:MAG: hypothetical protein A2019_04360 [Sulfurimonas sp. GWF2_37_8]|nr:MAG: hypothetical protein A2019_04360 [Sulfurimonas sp. GWF2_37_8]
MQNPFESGHIKNYLLLYASVVVIMVLFFIASTLFNDVQTMDKKIFNTNTSKQLFQYKQEENQTQVINSQIRLMDKVY